MVVPIVVVVMNFYKIYLLTLSPVSISNST